MREPQVELLDAIAVCDDKILNNDSRITVAVDFELVEEAKLRKERFCGPRLGVQKWVELHDLLKKPDILLDVCIGNSQLLRFIAEILAHDR
jgi:hypothetical protein